MKTCPLTTLKKHSAGETYAAILNVGSWELQNGSGDTLAGYQGKIYQFKSKQNAETWLCSNLARVKNASEATPVDFIVNLHKIYGGNQLQIVLDELETIRTLDLGLWSPVLCGECDCENEPIDGGVAASIYTTFINQ